MPNLDAIELIVDKNAIRIKPFEKQGSASSEPSGSSSSSSKPAGGGGRAATSGLSGNSTIDDALADDELDDEEIAELQKAAAEGDEESFDFLKQLGLPLGIAAGVGAAGYGIARGVAAMSDLNVMPSHGPDGANPINTAGSQRRLAGPPQPQIEAPARTGLIPDQTPTRFNQPAPAAQPAIPDQRTPYQQSGGKLPTGQSAGQALRKAAKVARRVK
jgi:hypothetical protein